MSQNSAKNPAAPKFLTPAVAPQGVDVVEHEEPPADSLVAQQAYACAMRDSPEGCDGKAPPGKDLCNNCARR